MLIHNFVESSVQEFTDNDTFNSSDEPSGSSSLYEEVPKKAKLNIISEKLVVILDKCRISDRNAVRLIIAVAECLGQNPDNLIVNRTSLQICRKNIRESRAKKLKERFMETNLTAAVLHWDGKLLPDQCSSNLVDRLPIIVTNCGSEKFLNIPMIQSGTGKDQAEAIYETLLDWDLLNEIKAICCDTTSSNLGVNKGAAIILEQMLERDLLYLPCRHHIYELILRAVFENKMPGTTGPNVAIFNNFKKKLVTRLPNFPDRMIRYGSFFSKYTVKKIRYNFSPA